MQLRSACLRLLAIALLSGAATSSAHAQASHRVMLLGDSITQGAAGDTTWRARLWHSLQAGSAAGSVDFVGSRTGLFNYAAGVQDGDTAYADPNFDQDHEGLWGLRLAAATSTIGATLAGVTPRPDTLVVELGTNDFAAGAAAATANLRLLIQRARAAAPGIDIVLVEPYPTWDQKYLTWTNRDFSLALAASETTLATELDTQDQRVVAAPLTDFDARTMSWDGRHPNPTGELVIATGVARALATIGIGDGPHVPATAVWPATAPAPSLSVSAQKVTVTWPDATIGALDYAIEARHTTAAGVTSAWARAGQVVHASPTWTSATLVGGDTYAFRIVPVRRAMSGTPGPPTSVTIPGAPVTTPVRAKPWWQWW